ncbi:hypothetical protein Bca52824_080563 [Brassica carinata]|nr:hypothetical protein Bca52824_080563 [Brassica carinata]
MVDTVVMFMAKAELFMYVDPSNYGLVRPKQGHFTTKFFTRRTPVISVGTSKRFAMTRLPESCIHEPFGQFPHR